MCIRWTAYNSAVDSRIRGGTSGLQKRFGCWRNDMLWSDEYFWSYWSRRNGGSKTFRKTHVENKWYSAEELPEDRKGDDNGNEPTLPGLVLLFFFFFFLYFLFAFCVKLNSKLNSKHKKRAPISVAKPQRSTSFLTLGGTGTLLPPPWKWFTFNRKNSRKTLKTKKTKKLWWERLTWFI